MTMCSLESSKSPLSAIILTYNEEKNIEECLKSVCEWVDEVFVVDSYSTDNTLKIVEKYTENICQHPFENYSIQRNWAQDNLPIRNEWVFHIDADERVTHKLSEELKGIFSKPIKGINGFLVSRRTVFLGQWIKHGGHYPAYHLRIFRKNSGRCEERLYDQHFYVNGRVEKLKNDIIDTITRDVDSWIFRHNKWATLEAMEIVQRGKDYELRDKDEGTADGDYGRLSKGYVIKGDKEGNPIEKRRWLKGVYYDLPIFIRPFLYFLYRYFFRLGFLDGKKGLIFHFLQGFWYRFLVDAKIYEYRRIGAKTD